MAPKVASGFDIWGVWKPDVCSIATFIFSGLPKSRPSPPWSLPRATQDAPRGAQEALKTTPKPQGEQRTEPRRSEHRLGSPGGGGTPSLHPPYGHGTPKRSQTEPKTMQNPSENSRSEQKTIQDDQGPVLAPSWRILAHLGAI